MLNNKYLKGPGEDTTCGFWQMIWQYEVQVVVMLTNLVEGCGLSNKKCNLYWPEKVGDIKRVGDLEIRLFDQSEVLL